MSRVLVTGATGFVGRELCRRLESNNVDYVKAIRHDDTNRFRTVAVGDISATTDWTLALIGVDVVVHLAGRAHILHDEETDPLAAFRSVNVDGTVNLARQAGAAGVRRFVFISTVKVLGEGGAKPYCEDSQPAPIGSYAYSKWLAECGLFQAANESGMEVVVLRPPLVYGPGVSANFLRLMQMVYSGWPLPFGRVCNNSRSLVFVDNLVSLIVVCLSHPLAAGRIFLVSDGCDLSISDLLSRLGLALHKPAVLIPVPVSVLKAGFLLLRKPSVAQQLLGSLQVDISRTRELLGWFPAVGVDEGLRVTGEYFLHSISTR